MSMIGNVLWILIGGGIVLAFEYLVGGLILCATIVGIPFGVQCFKLAGLTFLPFGKHIGKARSGAGILSFLMNVLWILIGGIWIAVTHLVMAVICAVTIIGIPFARQHLKLAGLALSPFGRTIR
ncbi:MAG: YccF domain-containing protein [Spirochaetales bacterium]|nr:MAG: YccF domain-containing protein [Spirochaetales bacterium]